MLSMILFAKFLFPDKLVDLCFLPKDKVTVCFYYQRKQGDGSSALKIPDNVG
jgi:hypothetical protein